MVKLIVTVATIDVRLPVQNPKEVNERCGEERAEDGEYFPK